MLMVIGTVIAATSCSMIDGNDMGTAAISSIPVTRHHDPSYAHMP